VLLGYVSDEHYVAIADVAVEVRGQGACYEARSRASGAIHFEGPPGRYEVILSRDGYGPKRCVVDVSDEPVQLRLLSDRMYGYAWPKWVASGATSQLRVSSRSAYRAELWRCGWQRKLVAPLGYDSHAPFATGRITPDGDYTRTGVDWQEPFVATAPQRSGLYYFHVHNSDGEFTSFPWIVTPARPTAPIAVLTSSATWNAYNNFGGRSNYIDPVALPPVPAVNRRQDLERYARPDVERWAANDYAPLSFDRPEPANVLPLAERITDPIEGRDACGLASAEWRLLGWLEREGFDYDLYADVQLHFGEVDLDAYRVLVLNSHPEYWSSTMYRRVRAWVERGGRLMYLGGNGINCEVDFPDRDTMVVRNGDGRILDADRDRLQSRFGMLVEPEATLLGVGFRRDGLMTGAPYQVVDADHWAFEGTGLAVGNVFGRNSVHTRCPGGASGHEMDKVTASSPPGTRVLAKGMNPGGSGAEMAHYELDSGGAVFSAGSINYPCSLPVDNAISAVTANVLRRFLR
jgi:N,N-dimethylformamidase